MIGVVAPCRLRFPPAPATPLTASARLHVSTFSLNSPAASGTVPHHEYRLEEHTPLVRVALILATIGRVRPS